MEAYRLGLFMSDVGWSDVTKLAADRRTMSLSDQLYRALGKISSNLAEGYSRGTGKARATFYEYALGSEREARDWYYKARHVLSERVAAHRMDVMTQLIKLTTKMVNRERKTNRPVSKIETGP